jgi:DNA modification methylase
MAVHSYLRKGIKLYFRDNFEILCEMDSERVDMICTDPPFNSGRDYNVFFKDSKAQNKAFTDIWTWDTEAEKPLLLLRTPSLNEPTRKVMDSLR